MWLFKQWRWGYHGHKLPGCSRDDHLGSRSGHHIGSSRDDARG
jgi:hypothetical protein